MRKVSRYSNFLIRAVRDAYLEAAYENKKYVTGSFEEFLRVVENRVFSVIAGEDFGSGRFSKRGYSVLRRDVGNSRLMVRVFAEAVLSLRAKRENIPFEGVICEVEGALNFASDVESVHD